MENTATGLFCFLVVMLPLFFLPNITHTLKGAQIITVPLVTVHKFQKESHHEASTCPENQAGRRPDASGALFHGVLATSENARRRTRGVPAAASRPRTVKEPKDRKTRSLPTNLKRLMTAEPGSPWRKWKWLRSPRPSGRPAPWRPAFRFPAGPAAAEGEPAVMAFSAPVAYLTHQQKVLRLYKRALRHLESWCIHRWERGAQGVES